MVTEVALSIVVATGKFPQFIANGTLTPHPKSTKLSFSANLPNAIPDLFARTFMMREAVGMVTDAEAELPNASLTVAVRVYDVLIAQLAPKTNALPLENDVLDTPLHDTDLDDTEFLDETLAIEYDAVTLKYVPLDDTVPSELHLLADTEIDGFE